MHVVKIRAPPRNDIQSQAATGDAFEMRVNSRYKGQTSHLTACDCVTQRGCY